MSLPRYREEAARQRLAAEETSLQNVRERIKAAADKLLGDPSENPYRGLAAPVRRDT